MRHGLPRSGGVFVVLSLCGILGPHCVFSASTPELPLSDLVRMSSTIVHGTVLETKSHWNDDHSLIVTDVRVSVTETLRGRSQPELTLVQPGGRVGKLRIDVDGAAAFLPGQEFILFLAPGARGALTPVALNHGSYKIEQDARSGRKRVLEAPSALLHQSVDLDAFLVDIRGRVRALPNEVEH